MTDEGIVRVGNFEKCCSRRKKRVCRQRSSINCNIKINTFHCGFLYVALVEKPYPFIQLPLSNVLVVINYNFERTQQQTERMPRKVISAERRNLNPVSAGCGPSPYQVLITAFLHQQFLPSRNDGAYAYSLRFAYPLDGNDEGICTPQYCIAIGTR